MCRSSHQTGAVAGLGAQSWLQPHAVPAHPAALPHFGCTAASTPAQHSTRLESTYLQRTHPAFNKVHPGCSSSLCMLVQCKFKVQPPATCLDAARQCSQGGAQRAGRAHGRLRALDVAWLHHHLISQQGCRKGSAGQQACLTELKRVPPTRSIHNGVSVRVHHSRPQPLQHGCMCVRVMQRPGAVQY